MTIVNQNTVENDIDTITIATIIDMTAHLRLVDEGIDDPATTKTMEVKTIAIEIAHDRRIDGVHVLHRRLLSAAKSSL